LLVYLLADTFCWGRNTASHDEQLCTAPRVCWLDNISGMD